MAAHLIWDQEEQFNSGLFHQARELALKREKLSIQ